VKSANTKPIAVVLDIAFGGYGIVRSLSGYSIDIIGIKSNRFIPEQGTRLCKKIYKFKNYEHLLDLLLRIAQEEPVKPILYLTGDHYVTFFYNFEEKIRNFYRISLPDKNTIEILLEKTKLNDFAIREQILAPKTLDLSDMDDIGIVKKNFEFPVILKPWLRTEKWKNNISDKAFLINDFENFKTIYDKISIFEKRLIVQEYIPGGDENVYYCLIYFDENSKCLGAFSGQKLRQWPVLTGTGTSYIGVENQKVIKETLRIFRSLNYKGFGSFEFKKHQINGKYYMIEPTAGRVDQNEYVSTINKMNLPLVAYCNLTNINIEANRSNCKPAIYIEEINEIRSALKHISMGDLNIKTWVKSLKGKKVYRYLTYRDPLISVYLLFSICLILIKKKQIRKTN
jgi:predicted ATP-grasp superfamily ATP-dependent carboligase